jgi:pilus assembly protein TadC
MIDVIQRKSHVFLALLPLDIVRPFLSLFSPVIGFFIRLIPSLKADLVDLDYEYSAEEYVGMGLVSYTLLGLLFGFLLSFLAYQKGRPLGMSILVGFGSYLAIVFFFTYFLARLPSITLRAQAVELDKYLIYALKELILLADSGLGLYESIVGVANSNYGELSKKFDWAVRKVSAGYPILRAIEDMVASSRSVYFKKAGWQIINSIKTGSNLRSTMAPIIADLDAYQKSLIQNYSRELNLWSLVYMMFSVAIPTIGSTMLVILSSFASFGVTREVFIGFVGVTIFIQIVLIYVVGGRRPNVLF